MFPQIFGKYVLQREIAAGGMARVYVATLRGAGGFEKRLVVKQIRPELASDQAFVDRFVEEAKTTVELSHPNIVPVYELGVEQGVYFIAMELCEGATLAEIVRETGPLEPEEGAYLGVEICRALDYAHRRAAVVHRDVTPRNVLVDDEGAVRVIDFGIAAPAGASRDTQHDGEGDVIPPDVLGSPGHMPPEQIAGKKLTPETDVFAVGALLVEAWTARPPFRRATVAECEIALSRELPALSAHDERLRPLDDVIARALRLDRKQRPASAEELARPLRDFLRTTDAGDIARRLGDRARRARRRGAPDGTWGTGGPSGDPLLDEIEAESRVGATRTFATRRFEETGDPARSEPPASPESAEGSGARTRRLPEHDGDAPQVPSDVPADPSTRRLASIPPPITGSEPAPRRAPSWRAAPWALGLAIVALVAIAAPWSGRGDSGASKSDAGTPATQRGPSRAAAPAPMGVEAASRAGDRRGDSGSLPTDVASAAPAPRAPAGTTAPRPGPLVGSGAAALDPVVLGTITATSDPAGMSATVGPRTGVTPFTVQLGAGTHAVGVTFAATGERVGSSVRLSPGATVRVHADFTGATPRVYHR